MRGCENTIDNYNIHPDFIKYKDTEFSLNPRILPIINFLMRQALNKAEIPKGINEVKHKIIGYKGKKIELSIFEPIDQNNSLPALVYFHGGAFALKAAIHHKKLACEYALRTPCKVVLVDYRLLPKNTFPVGLEDCYSSFLWVYKNAESLNIDKNKIAIGGDSAGGALAAGVSLLARDRKNTMPCFQMLIYPVTDARQTTDSIRKFVDTPLWNSKLNADMWNMYLKNVPPEKIKYASPMEATSLRGMPQTYIEVADYDCLRDEGIAFAKKLEDNDVLVELRKTQNTVHGFEVAENNETVIGCINRRISKLQEIFK